MTESHPGRSADSAGVPWHGRSVRPSGFEADDGSADPVLERLISGGTARLADVVAALPGRRLLVPVVAQREPAQDQAATARQGEEQADMVMVSLRAPDGRKTLPVFSSVRSMAAWNTTARPVPVESRRVALAALEESCELLIIDPASPTRLVVPRPALWALARGESWTPILNDAAAMSEILTAVRASCELIRTADCVPGRRAEIAIVIALPPNLAPRDLDDVTGAVSRAIAALEVTAQRVDSVELRFTG